MLRAIAPGKWADDGPQSATAAFGTVGATTGAAMLPYITNTPLPATAAEMQRRRRKAERQGRTYKNIVIVRCDGAVRSTGEPCGRRMGHGNSHHSAERVARDNNRWDR